jgi:hypothetical protein
VLIPILAVTVSTTAIQRAQFATTEISRQGVRALALATNTTAGHRAIRRIARLTLADFGMSQSARFTIACTPQACGGYGSLYRLTTTVTVPLAMIPALPGLDVLTRIPVSATATHRAPLPVTP